MFFGAIAATIAYTICDRMATPDQAVGTYQARGAYRFVFYVTALVGGAVFLVTMKLYKVHADKKYRASIGPPKAQALGSDERD